MVVWLEVPKVEFNAWMDEARWSGLAGGGQLLGRCKEGLKVHHLVLLVRLENPPVTQLTEDPTGGLSQEREI